MLKKWLYYSLLLFWISASAGNKKTELSFGKIQVQDTAVKITTTKKISVVEEKETKENTNDTETTKEKIKKELAPPPLWKYISFGKILWAIFFIILGYFLIRFIVSVLEKFSERSAKHRITIKGLIPIIKIFGWILIVVLIIVGIFQPPAATILALSASLGIAVGFAAQDVLKNVFGGVMILLDRPFQVGDKIEMGSHYGEVVEIGLRSIRIVTADDSLVSIPNGELMNSSVSNSNTGETNCQVVAEVYLPITVDTVKARQIAMETAKVSKYIYLNKPISVLFFNEIKERRSYFKMRLKAYVMDIRYEFAFKSDMTEMVIKEFIKAEVIDPDDLR